MHTVTITMKELAPKLTQPSKENFEASKQRGPRSGIGLIAGAAMAFSSNSAEAQDQSLSERLQAEQIQTEQSLRSGEIVISIDEYESVANQLQFDETSLEAMSRFTEAVDQATMRANKLLEDFHTASIVYAAERDHDPIAEYNVYELFSQLQTELAKVAEDSSLIDQQFQILSSNGNITRADCEKYGYEECVQAYKAFQSWKTETGLVPLTQDLANNVLEG